MPRNLEDCDLFFPAIREIHQIVAGNFNALEEEAFAWFDGILEIAKKSFTEDDMCLLPKTPATVKKTKGRAKKLDKKPSPRKKIFEDSGDSDFEQSEKKTHGKKRRIQSNASNSDNEVEVSANKVILIDEEDTDEDEKPVRRTRTTRANSRAAATTSKARKPRNANKSKTNKKIKSIDVIKNLEDDMRKTPTCSYETARRSSSRVSLKNASQTRISTDNSENQTEENIVVMEEWTQPASVETIALKHKIEPDNGDKLQHCPKTPLQNFSHMNVKEKVQAYEDIGHKTPVSEPKKRGSNSNKMTPENKITDTIEVQKTPDTIVTSKNTSADVEPCTPYYEEIIYEQIPALQGVGPEGLPSEKKNTPRISQTRKSLRVSIRKSLKMLPSQEKRVSLHVQSEVEEQPVRTRTKLRLKKKDKATDGEACSSQDNTDSTEEKMETDGPLDSELEQKETRSTRTKTRQEKKQMETSESGSEKEHIARNDSGFGHSSSEESKRLTMTKTQPEVEPRTTRTKTRKRQLEEEAEPSTRNSAKRSRSCINPEIPAEDKTPTRKSASSSSDEGSDYVSPICPTTKVIRPHPKSFLNKLKPLSTTPLKSSSMNPGLVRSFIARNSPAKKPTLKELQLKKKQELLEKERRQQELRRKREEEHKQKIEETKRKREEKMRKVQESREQREKLEKENRLNLEKKMAEHKKLTDKMKEDKIKEEVEKKKLREQKLHEAEERRKHEEEERKRKLLEQLNHEKSQSEFMQRKKEFEEQERLKKFETEKQRTYERQLDIEKEREKERERLVKIQAVEDEKQKEWLKKKEEREKLIAKDKLERERLELQKKKERDLQLKKEMDRLKEQERLRNAENEKQREQQRKQDLELHKMVQKHNSQIQNQPGKLPKPNLNKTHSLNEPTVSQDRNDSYELTPDRAYKPATEDNYNIDDIKSDDETDDDDAPRKVIPDWAQGALLKAALIKQHLHPPNLDLIFDLIEPPDLNTMFDKKKARFNKRTSSAHWDTPILKPGLFGRT